ncbi:hypothetical protein OG739_18325 [Streptomyces longwoodensis]|nr:hypothetical protein OG547_17770 [Streptomyces longwoodensis]
MPQVAPQVAVPDALGSQGPALVAPQVNPQINPQVNPLVDPTVTPTSAPELAPVALGQIAAPPVGQLGLPRLG